MGLGVRVGTGVFWAVGAAGMVAACGDDDPPAIQCGRGTVLEGSVCVAAEGGASGGRSGSGGAQASGAAGPNTGGSVPSTGGSTSGKGGGVTTGTGGTDSDSGAGGADPVPEAGTGGSRGGEGGTDDPDSGTPPRSEPRWIAVHGDGAYLYDLERFGETDAAVRVADSFPDPVWSPDGRWLLSRDTAGISVRSVRGATLGAPTLLGEVAGELEWSADAKTLSSFTGNPILSGVLSVFNPFVTAPVMQPVASDVVESQWAPKGSLLYYVTATGGRYFVPVSDGVPGVPKKIEGAGTNSYGTWAPDGAHFVLSTSEGRSLLDARTTPPAVRSNPCASSTSAMLFSFDGGWVACELTGAVRYAPYSAGSFGTLLTVPGVTAVSSWAPNTNVLVSSRSSPHAVSVLGSSGFTQPRQLPAGVSIAAFSDDGSRVVVRSATALEAYATTGTAAPRSLLPVPTLPDFKEKVPELVRFSRGSTVAYPVSASGLQPAGVRIQDVDSGESSFFQPNGSSSDNVRFLEWSPGGTFLAVFDASGRTALVRVQGTKATAPINPRPQFQQGRFFFQPL